MLSYTGVVIQVSKVYVVWHIRLSCCASDISDHVMGGCANESVKSSFLMIMSYSALTLGSVGADFSNCLLFHLSKT